MKIKLNEKIKYMFFGALIALFGFGLGSLVTGVDTQNGEAQFEKLTVQHLLVPKGGLAEIEDMSVGNLVASKRIGVKSDKTEDLISLFVDEESNTCMILVTGNGGIMVTDGKKGHVSITTVKGNGTLTVKSKGQGSVVLTEYSGDGEIYRRDRFGRAQEVEWK